MAVLSRTTLLAQVNNVLQQTGEFAVPNLSNRTAQQAKTSVCETLVDLSTRMNWSWLKAKVAADSWVNEVAQLPSNFRLLHNVYYVSGRRLALTPVEEDILYARELQPTSSSILTGTYANVGYGQFAFSPYPTTFEEQAKFLFEIQEDVALPELPTDFVPVPDRFLRTLTAGACKHFSNTHLHDVESARTFERDYETDVFRLMQQEGSTNRTTPLSMYNRGRR